ncbi:MAG: MIP family channel protein [Dehalococcoidia bacterium]|nr:MIP family channel protein [Dehalococcoidia bacterium]
MPTTLSLRACAAEALGTFLLVFAGPGAVVVDRVSGGGVTSLGIGLSFGLAVMVAIYALGYVSGAHINPAVTLAFAAMGEFPRRLVPAYIGAQLLGAVGASAAHRALFGNVAHLGATMPSGGAGQALLLEVILTFFLMLVIAAFATDYRAVAGTAAIAIGGYVALAATFAGPIAGASMNPARSFGPALLSGTWTVHWVYWLGPIAGALLGGVVYAVVAGPLARAPAQANATAADEHR